MHALATLPRGLHMRILEKRNRLVQSKISSDVIRNLEEHMQVEFVYNSNSIEGVTLSRGETELAIRGMTVQGKSIADVLAAQNHPQAIQLVQDLILENKKLSERDILDIHKAIMSGIMSTAGEYRRYDVHIVGASFAPPPPYQIQEEIKQLLEFVNENPAELRPVELAAHAHYYLAWIHPFDDGNGRMARLLMNLILLKNRYPFAIVRKVDRKKYLDTLDAVSSRGAFEPFLIYIARCVEQTLDLYLNVIARSKGRPKEKLRTLSELAKGTPYSAEYLSLQARKGVLDAVKVGRIWMSTKKTIETYISEHGRKRKISR
jgi:Fic family protein